MLKWCLFVCIVADSPVKEPGWKLSCFFGGETGWGLRSLLVVSFSLQGQPGSPGLKGESGDLGPQVTTPMSDFQLSVPPLCPLTISVSPLTRAPEDLRASQALLARLGEG